MFTVTPSYNLNMKLFEKNEVDSKLLKSGSSQHFSETKGKIARVVKLEGRASVFVFWFFLILPVAICHKIWLHM